MKKLLLIFILTSLMTVGCKSANNHLVEGNGLYSSDPNKYNLLIFTDESKSAYTDWFNWKDKNHILKVDTYEGRPTTLNKAKDMYKTLKIDKLPYYV